MGGVCVCVCVCVCMCVCMCVCVCVCVSVDCRKAENTLRPRCIGITIRTATKGTRLEKIGGAIKYFAGGVEMAKTAYDLYTTIKK